MNAGQPKDSNFVLTVIAIIRFVGSIVTLLRDQP